MSQTSLCGVPMASRVHRDPGTAVCASLWQSDEVWTTWPGARPAALFRDCQLLLFDRSTTNRM